jgi:anti-sigma B factor antagonist
MHGRRIGPLISSAGRFHQAGRITTHNAQSGREITLEIHTRKVGDVHVLDLSGKITLGAATRGIRHTISDLLVNGGRKIVLNLRDVNYIDSSGIGELLRTYTTVTSAGKQLRLLNLTAKVRELLVITKLLTVFQGFENEQAAIASFA